MSVALWLRFGLWLGLVALGVASLALGLAAELGELGRTGGARRPAE